MVRESFATCGNGSLQSLDMTVSSNIIVGGFTIDTNDLEFQYASGLFSLSGSTDMNIPSLGDLDLNFGYTPANGTPQAGLVVSSGTLQSLNMTVTSNIVLGGFLLGIQGLEFQYSGGNFDMGGSVALTIPGLGNLTAAFATGTGSAAGLVISNGALQSINMTLTSNIVLGSFTFTTSGLNFTYSSSSSQFTLTGSAAVASPLGNINVTFGYGNLAGLVITNGTLQTMNMTLNSNLVEGGFTLNTTGLDFTYTAGPPSSFTLTGPTSLTIPGLGTLAATFGYGTGQNAVPGLVITSGTLQSLNMTLNSNFTLGGITLSTMGLQFDYSASASSFTLSGTTSLTIPNLGNLSATFGFGTGQSALPGLVISGGSLQTLNMTLNSNLTVGGFTLTTTGLQFGYSVSASSFTLSGSTSLTIPGLGSIAVTFGYGTGQSALPGLVITNGSLVSLDMTLNTNISEGGFIFTTSGLEFTYTAAGSVFTIPTGTAGVTIPGLGSISVGFGQGTGSSAMPGLVINNGSLSSLDMTLNSNISVGGFTFTTTGLDFTYTTSGNVFTIGTGMAGVMIPGLGSINVSFGYGTGPNAQPGLVISNHQLQSLDMTLDTNIVIGGFTLTTSGLQFTYSTSSELFTLAGSAGVMIPGLGNINVTFGYGSGASAQPGLEISNGSLTLLDMTLNTNISVGGLTITTSGLNFTYTPQIGNTPSTFSLAGNASVSIAKLGSLSVTFGHDGNPGLVINNGALQTLDMAVSGSFTIASVTVAANDLEFKDASSTTSGVTTNTFTLSGTASIAVASFGNVSVTFGHGSTPGLVLNTTNGVTSLASLDMTLNANVTLFGLNITTTGLEFSYTASTSTFSIPAGTVTVTVPSLGNLSATFGDSAGPGLVVANGTVTQLHLSVSGSFNLFGLTISANSLTIDYSGNELDISGGASLMIPSLGGISVSFPQDGLEINTQTGAVSIHGISASVSVTIGGFQLSGTFSMSEDSSGTVTYAIAGTIDLVAFTVNANAKFAVNNSGQVDIQDIGVSLDDPSGIPIGESGVYLTELGGDVMNIGTPQLTVSVSAAIRYGPNLSFAGSGNYSLLTASASLSISQYALTGTMSYQLVGGYLGSGTANIDLDWSKGYYHADMSGQMFDGTFTYFLGFTFKSSGGLVVLGEVSVNVPDFVPVYGGDTLGDIGFYFQYIPGDNADSFAAVWLQILGATVGVQVDFNDNWTFPIGSSAVAAYQQDYANFTAEDGRIAGGTVFYDPNDTGVLTGDDPSTTSAADGSFALVYPLNQGGQLVLTGGEDISTGLPNTATLTAPADAKVISPLTTLVNDVMQQSGMSESNAELAVSSAFGYSPNIDVDSDDIINLAQDGNAKAAQIYANEIQVANLTTEAGTALAGVPGAPSVATMTSEVYAALAQIIIANGTVNLASQTTILSLIQSAASAGGVAIGSSITSGDATVIAALNSDINALTVAGSTAYLLQVIQVQVVGQGTVAPLFAQASAGTANISTIVNNETGSNLASQISAAVTGELNPPSLSISNVVKQDGTGNTTYQFTVTPTSTGSPLLPVSVVYTTEDGSAVAADGDYTPTTGTLTWAPGNISPRTINVVVAGSSATQASKDFNVVLSDPKDAVITNSTGVGTIVYNNYSSTVTTLTSSAPTAAYTSALTLTSTVTDPSFPSQAPMGDVSFYDGATLLGTIPLDSTGKAQFLTTALALGTHPITADYLGEQDVNGVYWLSPSNSGTLTQMITILSQTISDTPVTTLTYGHVPISLDATAASSDLLALSYSVVSGPGTIGAGNMLSFTGAGTVVVAISQPGTTGVSAATTVDESFVVQPVALVFTVNNEAMLYGSTVPTLTGNFSGFINGDTAANLTTQPTLSVTQPVNGVGTYTITASGASDPDYSITYITGTLTVSPATVTVTANNQTMVYGGTTPTLTASYLGLENGDTASSLTTQPTLSIVSPSSNVGTYTIAISGAVDPNYNFIYIPGTLTITPASLTITAANQTMVYGGTMPTLTANYSGLVNGDTANSLTVTPTLLTAPSYSSVGSYTITVSGAADSNYSISYVPGTLSVTPAPLTITANSQTMTYGSVLPTLTATYTTLVNGDTTAAINGLVLSTVPASSHVGTYTITASGATDSNYTIALVNGSLNITPAPLTITAANQTKVYGTSNPTLTYSITGWVNGDSSSNLVGTPMISTTATTSSGVAGSPYPITVSGGSESDYTITDVPGTLAVTPAALTVTVTSNPSSSQVVPFTKEFGAPNPAFTVAYSGFVLGQGSSALGGTLSFTTTAPTTGDVGTYAVNASGLTSTNYNIIYVAGALSITAAPTTVALTSSSSQSAYGQTITFIAKVSATAPASGIPVGVVQFYDGAVLLGSVNLDSTGAAQLTTSSLSTTTSTTGTHVVSAVYLGSNDFLVSTATVSIIQSVNQTGTSTSLTSSANPTPFGHLLTLTATVTSTAGSSDIPTGSVNFFLNGVLFQTVALDPTGTAICTTNALTIGTYSFTAVYSGDANNITSTSSTLSELVNKDGSSMVIDSLQNPSVYGEVLTFTAAVSPADIAAGTPTGTVTFYDGATPLGTETLVNGDATFTTSSLAVGTHSISAVYSGDTDFLSSLAPTIFQTVQAAASPVASVVINNGQQQRSRVTSITVTFSGVVTPSELTSAFSLQRASDDAAIGTIAVSSSVVSGETVATLTFSGTNTEATSLADGNWTLTVNHTQITAGGLPMSSDYVQPDIKRLFGDMNGTGTVDSSDLGIFGTTFGLTSTSPAFIAGFDSDGNGIIDSTDLGAFGTRFGLSI